MAFYFDTSALVKLVSRETETPALRAWIDAADPIPVASDLVRTELLRAVRRRDPAAAVDVRTVLDTLTLLSIPSSVFDAAGLLAPLELRSLDAVHLASALSIGDDLEGLVTYDARMADAARAAGISVVAPA